MTIEQGTQDTSTPDEDDTSKNEDSDENKGDELAKAKEVAENQRIRAEKAEKKLKDKPAVKEETSKPAEVDTPKNEAVISPKDSARLMQAEIPVDDWDDVINYAEFKGLSIEEALKTSVVKATLSEKSEERKTASATNTGGTKRGSTKISGEKLLIDAERGKLPDSTTTEEIQEMWKARKGIKA